MCYKDMLPDWKCDEGIWGQNRGMVRHNEFFQAYMAGSQLY